MSREIKFRGKDLDTNEWCYGCLEFMDEYLGIIHAYNKRATTAVRFVSSQSVGQFTGLRDKNGKDIYEGDILSIASKSNKPFGVVMWHKEGYFCVEENLSASEPSDHISLGELLRASIFEFEVIGNIHDNPELLNE